MGRPTTARQPAVLDNAEQREYDQNYHDQADYVEYVVHSPLLTPPLFAGPVSERLRWTDRSLLTAKQIPCQRHPFICRGLRLASMPQARLLT